MLAVVSTPEMHFCFINKRNHHDDDDDNYTMHYNCDSDDDKIMNPRHNSGRDVHDNNVRNVGNIFVSYHAVDVILCFLRMLLLIKRVIVACTMEAMVTASLLFVMVIMGFMLRLFLFFRFE